MPLEPGGTVGPYAVERLLYDGDHMEVFLAKRDGMLFALKAARPEREGPLHDAVILEGRILSELNHPYLLRAVDMVEDEEFLRPVLVLEYVPGTDLAEWLDDPHPLRERIEVFADIVDALRVAHDAGYVHRDLKPENVLITVHTNRSIPKLADFGMAKMLGARKPGLSNAFRILGTPAYMAPEQMFDVKNVDHRADLWSLGAILYEMVTGTVPFEGSNPIARMAKARKGEYTPATEVVPGLPRRIHVLISNLLVPDPAERMHDCADLLDGLRDVLRREEYFRE